MPTNAQLTLTLLRLGEAHKTPLPPPPLPDAKLPNAPKARQIKRDLPVDASPDDIAANSLTPASSKSEETPKKKKPGSKILSILKGTARVGVTTIMGVDRVKATAGSESALDRLGVLHPHARRKPPDGPSEFVSRYEGAYYFEHAVWSQAALKKTSAALRQKRHYHDLNNSHQPLCFL